MRTCTYCGDIATSRDHVIPRSYLRSDGKPNWRKDWTVPACHMCNSYLSSLLIPNIPDRASYLYWRYKRVKSVSRERLGHLCCVANLPIPEPKPKPLKETSYIAEQPRKVYTRILTPGERFLAKWAPKRHVGR